MPLLGLAIGVMAITASASAADPTTTVLQISPTLATCADTLTLSAVVSPAGVSGSVDFMDGASLFGTVPIASDGTASLRYPRPPVGTHEFEAFYRGDPGHDESRSGLQSQPVGKVPLTATLSTSPIHPVCLQTTTVTITVTPPPGNLLVRFQDGSLILAFRNLTNGIASFPATLLAGPHSLVAQVTGDACYESTVSDTLPLTVGKAPATVSVSSDFNPAKVDDRVRFTARMTPVLATGSVAFFDHGTVIGTGQLTNGAVTLPPLSLDEGEHAITAVYGGNACYLDATSPTLTQIVGARPTLSIDDASIVEGYCGSSLLRFVVRLSSRSSQTITATFSTQPGTATADVDYRSTSGTIQFAPFDTSETLAVRVFGDGLTEPPEVFHVQLADPVFATIADGTGDGTILDDGSESVAEDPPLFFQQWSTVENPFGLELFDHRQLLVATGPIRFFSLKGVPDRQIAAVGAYALAVDADSNLFSAGWPNQGIGVTKWTVDGDFIRFWGGEGTGPGQFQTPRGIAIAPNGEVFVTDGSNGMVSRFTNDGAYLGRWSVPGTLLWGIAIDPDGFVYVAYQAEVAKYTPDGQRLLSWGAAGDGSCEFGRPRGLALDRAGNVYVADGNNHRIQKFTPDGRFICQWGHHGAGPGEFEYPSDVVVDSAGHVYVADMGNRRIQKFGPPDRVAPTVVGRDTTVSCGPAGAIVVLAAHAEDNVDPNPVISFDPPSGSLFPAGTTVVTCTATDASGNAGSSTFTVTVNGVPCPEKSGVRIDEVAFMCGNGDSTAQFLELIAAEDSQFSGALLLRVMDSQGVVRAETQNLFGSMLEGSSWPQGRRWLLGGAGLISAGITPDGALPPLDILGGRLTLLVPGSDGYRVLHEVVYGTMAGQQVLPGQSLQRQWDDTMLPNSAPSPTNSVGTTGIYACPCLTNELSACDGHTTRTTAPASAGGCTASVRYDLRIAEVAGNCSDNGSDKYTNHSNVMAQDTYFIVGPALGSTATISIDFHVHAYAESYPNGSSGADAGSSLRLGDSLLSVNAYGNSNPPSFWVVVDTTVSFRPTLATHRPFVLVMRSSVSCKTGYSNTSGRISFSDLPPGAAVISCQGFSGQVATPTLVSISGVDVESDLVRIRWYRSASPGWRATVYRSSAGGAWESLGGADADGAGTLLFEDRDVVPGRSYGYRLALDGDSDGGPLGETWVTVPMPDALSLETTLLNASPRQMRVRFGLRGGLPARIVLADVAGRVIVARNLDHGRGQHEIELLGGATTLRPGLYFLKLTEGTASRRTRALVIP